MKTLSTAARVRTARLGAPVRAVLTAMSAGSAARRALYQSRRWRTVSAAFLRRNPRCATPDCTNRATIVDHREGHQHANWRARFWDASLWQPLCIGCHAAKSASERAAWRSSGEGLPFQALRKTGWGSKSLGDLRGQPHRGFAIVPNLTFKRAK